MSPGEEILKKNLVEALHEPNEIFDIAAIIGIIGTIFGFIKSCRSPATAVEHAKRGSAIAYVKVRQTLRSEGYSNLREKTQKVMDKAQTISDEDWQIITTEAADSPPENAPIPWWPTTLLLFALFVPASAFAQERNFWPVDDLQNQRLEQQAGQLEAILQKLRGIDQRLVRIEGLQAAPEPVLPQPPVEVTSPVKPNGLRTASIPFSKSVWYEGGRYPSVAHVVAHGCPLWVAQMYANQPVMLGRIHGGYHEKSPRLLVTESSAVLPRSDAKFSLVASAKAVAAVSPCPNGVCPRQIRRR